MVAHGLIVLVTNPDVAETYKTVIEEMKHGTDVKLVNML